MKNRKTPSLNVGSMADIAFLLLIFFLVSTTIESDEGISQNLPKWNPENNGPTPRNLVLDIMINGENEFLVNGERSNLEEVVNSATAFYTNSGVFENANSSEDFPKRKWVDKNRCAKKLSDLNSSLSGSRKLEYWKDHALACEVLGKFKAFPDRAIINISYSPNTSYATFIEVRNAVQVALNILRDQLALEHAGKLFENLNEQNERERKLKKAIMVVYPQSVSDELLSNKKAPKNGALV